MPIDLEMFLSASPPSFTHSAFLDFHYDIYYRNAKNKRAVPRIKAQLTRSCISNRVTSVKSKKKVQFADDKGQALTTVHILPDLPSEGADLQEITRGLKPQVASDTTWQPSFAQPSTNYADFRAKLDSCNVCLENVVVREGEDTITGTIKVKNICFEKEVLIRITFNRWLEYSDYTASYINSASLMDQTSVDTFAFSVPIPPSAEKYEVISFCICLKTSNGEFWDNYDGSNYRLVLVRRKIKEFPLTETPKKFSDLDTADFDRWSEFASWNNLITIGPYW